MDLNFGAVFLRVVISYIARGGDPLFLVQTICSNQQEHIGWIVSLKLCRNLCSFKQLKINLRSASSLRPGVSCIA